MAISQGVCSIVLYLTMIDWPVTLASINAKRPGLLRAALSHLPTPLISCLTPRVHILTVKLWVTGAAAA